MKRALFIGWLLLAGLAITSPVESAEKLPNFVLIFCDDLGYGDLGCFGSEIKTPNLDALASAGVRFSHFYAYPRCCSTRASLLTGLSPHQAGVGHMTIPMPEAAYQGYLNENCVTIAEVLRGSGYRTMMSGKWHVGGAYPIFRPDRWRPGRPGFPTPFTRGFDEHFGTPWKVLGANVGWGLVLTCLLFAFGHSLIAPQWWHAFIFFPSLVFGWMRAKTGGPMAGALFHAWCNVTVATLDTLYGVSPL